MSFVSFSSKCGRLRSSKRNSNFFFYLIHGVKVTYSLDDELTVFLGRLPEFHADENLKLVPDPLWDHGRPIDVEPNNIFATDEGYLSEYKVILHAIYVRGNTQM